MTGRSRMQNLAASPTMVGAVTVLVTVVAVFLAYQANTGLPFVPTYRISAKVPNANSLVPGNEVRVGGVQVGTIENVVPEEVGADTETTTDDTGEVYAKVDLKLDKSVEPIPEDSTVIVRARSALGLKYLEIDRGSSDQGFAEGAAMPLSAARPEPVDIDQVLNTFDEPTQRAIQVNLREFGTAVAGRGGSINNAIGELVPLVRNLTPVMKNLASPQTGLSRFVSAISAAAAEVAPSPRPRRTCLSLSTPPSAPSPTSPAPSSRRRSPRDRLPRTSRSATLPTIRPFLGHTASLFADLRPGFAALVLGGPGVADALIAGIPALRKSPAFNAQLPPTTQSLVDLSNDPTSREGIDDATAGGHRPQQPDLVRRPRPEHVQLPHPAHPQPRQSVLDPERGRDLPALRLLRRSQPRRGPQQPRRPLLGARQRWRRDPNFLHYNPYPNTASPGQTHRVRGRERALLRPEADREPPGNQGILTEKQTKTQLGS